MKYPAFLTLLVAFGILPSCSSQTQSPASEAPRPTQTPLVRTTEQIDPADVINVETSEPGETLLVNRAADKLTLDCDKFNRVMINSSDHEVTISGVCNQVTINGRRNKVTLVAAAEIVAYGRENTVEYSKYANGKKPVITDTSGSNTITKVAATAAPANTKSGA